MLLYLALALLLRDRIRPFPAWLTIDGVLAGLTLAALASAVFVRSATRPRRRGVAATSLAVVCDLLLLVVVLVGFAATGWRPGARLVAARRRARGLRVGDTIFVVRSPPDLRRRHAARQPVAARARR